VRAAMANQAAWVGMVAIRKNRRAEDCPRERRRPAGWLMLYFAAADVRRLKLMPLKWRLQASPAGTPDQLANQPLRIGCSSFLEATSG